YHPIVFSQSNCDGKYSIRVRFESPASASVTNYLISCVVDEFNKIINEGLSEDLLFASKAQFTSNLYKDLKSAKFWSDYLRDKVANADDPTEILKRETIAKLITQEEVKAFVTANLHLNNFAQFILLPKEDTSGQ